MQTSRPRPRLGNRSTATIAGAVVIAALMLDLLELPVEGLPPLGMLVLVLAGAGLAWAGGGLAATLAGGSAAIGLAVLLSAFVHRAFGQTPWRMYAVEFLPLLALTVAVVVVGTGGGLARTLAHPARRRQRDRPAGPARRRGDCPRRHRRRDAVRRARAGGHPDQRPGGARLGRRRRASCRARHLQRHATRRYVLMEADAELLYLPVTSDAEAERRMAGDLVDRDGLAGYIVPRDLANGPRGSSFVPGRYVLVAVEPQEPIDESTILILDPEDPPPDTRTMRTDIAPVEFTVTD